jgi:hypothetical protein
MRSQTAKPTNNGKMAAFKKLIAFGRRRTVDAVGSR